MYAFIFEDESSQISQCVVTGDTLCKIKKTNNKFGKLNCSHLFCNCCLLNSLLLSPCPVSVCCWFSWFCPQCHVSRHTGQIGLCPRR